ncbi:MAG: histidinol-phosphate transaminase [Chloroflexota bacterium]
MTIRPRPEIEAVTSSTHGGFDSVEFARLGLDFKAVIDFSANINPFGPSPKALAALQGAAVDRHPDPEATELRRLIAAREGIGTESILVGNGSAELIRLLAIAYLRAGDRVLIVEPTFGEYGVSSAMMGAQVRDHRARPEDGFRLNVEMAAHQIEKERPRLVFLCNPNNPTGTYLSRRDVERLLAACEGTLLVVDEAFVTFVADAWSSIPLTKEGNLLVLRSMTKDYALAGLRLGYAVAHREIIVALAKVRPPWSVNALAQAAGVAALLDERHLRESLAELARAKEALIASLADLEWKVLPSMTHFFLVEVARSRPFRRRAPEGQSWEARARQVGAGAAFRRILLEQGILVRDCASFGLPACVRIATRRPEENRRLIETIRRSFKLSA